MSVFIELTTDAFDDVFAQQSSSKKSARRAGADSVRRPLRGLEIKDDTYAIIKVIMADGTEVRLTDSSSYTGTSTSYSNFILQSVQEARMEKHQILETFGEPFLYLFGEAPRFLDVSAVLVDSNDFNWQAEFWDNYEKYFRGSRLAERGARIYLFYNDNIVEGYMLQAQAVNMAEQPMQVMLSFRMYLTRYQNISFIGDGSYPIRPGASLPEGLSFDQTFNGEQINEIARTNGLSGLQTANGFAANAPLRRDLALRGKIYDNVDEWTGPLDDGFDSPTNDSDLDPFREAPDLTGTSINQLQAFGANIDNPTALAQLGLQAHVSASVGIGIGAGASVGATASFGARAGGTYGYSGSAVAGGGFGVGASASAGASAYKTQSFGAVASSPGYGSGSVLSYQASAEASALAATDTSSAYAYAGASYGGGYGAGSGASAAVGGKATCFAMVAADGDLDASADAYANAYASAQSSF